MEDLPEDLKCYLDGHETAATLDYEEFCSNLMKISTSMDDCYTLLSVLIYLEVVLKIDNGKEKTDKLLQQCTVFKPIDALCTAINKKHEKTVRQLLEFEGMYWNQESKFKVNDVYSVSSVEVILNFLSAANFKTLSATRFCIFHRSLDGINKLADSEKLIVDDSKLVWLCIYFGLSDILQILILNGARTDYWDPKEGTILHIAITKVPNLVVKTILPCCKEQVKSNMAKHGNTPLHLCKDDSYFDIAKELVRLGADVNAVNEFGCTPLHNLIAPDGGVALSDMLIYKLLVDHGAQTDKRNYIGLIPGDLSVGKHTIPLKVTVLGSAAVGKSSLLLSLTEGISRESMFATIGCDFKKYFINIDDQINYNLEVWDIAANERYSRSFPMYLHGTTLVVIMFDITRIGSLQDVPAFVELTVANSRNACIALIGNKIDLTDREFIPAQIIENYKNCIEISMKSKVL